MPNYKSISFKMAVLQGGGQNLLSPCRIGLSKCISSDKNDCRNEAFSLLNLESNISI